MTVVVLSNMTEIPKNCVVCPFTSCSLPLKKNGFELRKDALSSRDKRCPLKEMEVKP